MAKGRKRKQQLPAILALGAALLAGVIAIALWIGGSTADGEGADPDAFASEEPQPDAEWSVDEPEGELAEDEFAATLARVAVSDVGAIASATDAPADLAPADGLTARGTLLDAATGEPLPFYNFELQDAGREDTLVSTDERGVFEANEKLRRGPLLARYFEAGAERVSAGELRADDDGRSVPLQLSVSSGPTYRFVMVPTPPPPLEEFVPRLDGKSSNGAIRASGRIGGGTAAWVRFRPIPEDAQPDGFVVLDSLDGVWHGSSPAPVGPGLQGGVISVRMQSFAALEVVVQEPDGSALRNALVEWRPDGDAKPKANVTPESGRTEFVRMESEPGTLRVRKLRYADFEVRLAPRTGERLTQVVPMTLLPSAGSIGGRILSDTGSYSRPVTVHLLPYEERGGVKQLSARVEWTGKQGARVGTFQFFDLPAGKWRMAVAESDWFEWEPHSMNVETPILSTEFRVHDAVSAADLVFEPIGDDGEPVRDFQVRLLSGSDQATQRSRGQSVVVEAFPLENPLRWRLDSAGHASVFGDWSSLSPLESVSGRERRGVRPVLDHGAAQMFRIIRSDNKRPIEDVVAVVDGREVGRTDKTGRIVLHTEDESARIAFRWKEWRMLDAASWSGTPRRNAPFERTIRLEVPKSERKRR